VRLIKTRSRGFKSRATFPGRSFPSDRAEIIAPVFTRAVILSGLHCVHLGKKFRKIYANPAEIYGGAVTFAKDKLPYFLGINPSRQHK
jgi:hypothetical protein